MDASAWDARYAESELVWSKGPNQFVASELADLPPGKALDLAAGEGRNAIWLARRGWQVTAVDFSQVALDKGRKLAGDTEVEWVCADASTWTRTGYDLALFAYLQVPEVVRRSALRNAFAGLNPGGLLFVVAHDSTNLTDGTGGPQDPRVLYTAEDVLADLPTQHEVVRAERVARVVPAKDEHGSEGTAWDALALVRRTG